MDILIGLLVLGGLAAIGFKLWFMDQDDTSVEREQLRLENQRITEESLLQKVEKDRLTEDIGRLKAELEEIRRESDRAKGSNKTMYVQVQGLEKERSLLVQENQELKKKVTQFESEREQRHRDQEKLLTDTKEIQKSLEDEKLRVRREDEERAEQVLADKTRIWNDHENTVVATVQRVALKPEFGFEVFGNNNLPSDWINTGFKPDVLVSFLGQYIIFDAKFSDQKSPSQYFRDQVKKTAQKAKDNPLIYPVIFLVVPSNRLDEIKETSFVEDQYSFYVVPCEAIEPILANFKRIREYETLAEIDPQERENIVNLIAHYDRHISFHNAANMLLAQESINLMRSKSQLSDGLQSEVDVRKEALRDMKFKDSEVRKLARDLDQQEKTVEKLTTPRQVVGDKDLLQAQNQLGI